MNETIVRSAFGVVLTRAERRGATGAVEAEYRLSTSHGTPVRVFADFADADTAWLFALGGEPEAVEPPERLEAAQLPVPSADPLAPGGAGA